MMPASEMPKFLKGQEVEAKEIKDIKATKAQLISLADPKCSACSGVGHRGTYYPVGERMKLLLLCGCVDWEKIKEEPEGELIRIKQHGTDLLSVLKRPHPKMR